MINNDSQNSSTSLTTRGFAMPMIIAIIALIIVISGVSYFVTNKQPQTAQSPIGEKTLEDGTVVKADGTTVKSDGTMVMPDGTMVKPDGTMEKKEGETMMEKPSDAEAMEGKEDGAMMAKYTGTVLAGKSAPLLDYNKADYDAAIASDKLVVLYFYANWCPICKEELASATYPTFNELTTDKVVGIRINYKDSDTTKDEEDLARKYGIAYQHTKVLVKDGKQIIKGLDTWDKARYTTEINKALAQ